MSLDGFNAHALTLELGATEKFARLQKFSQLTESDFVLHLRYPGRTDKLLISIHQDKSRFHLLTSGHPAAIVPSSFVMLCRKHVGGTALTKLFCHGLDRKLELQFSSGFSLVFDWAGRPSAVLLVKTEERKIVGAFPGKGRYRIRHLYPEAEESALLNLGPEQAWEAFSQEEPGTTTFQALENMSQEWAPLWKRRLAKSLSKNTVEGVQKEEFQNSWRKIFEPLANEQPERFKAGIAADKELTYASADSQFKTLHEACNTRWRDSSLAPGVSDFRSELIKTLKKQRDKAARKFKKRQQDRKGAESAPQDQIKGDLLLAYASGLKRGQKKFETQDWEGRDLTIALDPKLTATENADRYYNKSKKKKRALVVLETQIALAQEEIEMWDELMFSAETSENRTDLEQVRKSMPKSRQRGSKKKVPQAPTTGPRKFQHHDFQILVGRNPSQNEKLSLKTAAKDDHWLHVRQGAGSHVVIRCAGAEPPADTLEAAAWLAAKYSRSAESRAVEIITTRARFLKKPKTGPLGKVIYRQETEIVADPTSSRPQGLTGGEENS